MIGSILNMFSRYVIYMGTIMKQRGINTKCLIKTLGMLHGYV